MYGSDTGRWRIFGTREKVGDKTRTDPRDFFVSVERISSLGIMGGLGMVSMIG